MGFRSLVVLALCALGADALSCRLRQPRTLVRMSLGGGAPLSRRETMIAVGGAVLMGGAKLAFADEEDLSAYETIPVAKDKMGGLLEPFSEVGKGWRIMKPYSWNQFEQLPGVYEMKWVDLVATNRQEIVVTTSPVKSTTTSVSALGDVKALGAKLAEARSSELVEAKAVIKVG